MPRIIRFVLLLCLISFWTQAEQSLQNEVKQNIQSKIEALQIALQQEKVELSTITKYALVIKLTQYVKWPQSILDTLDAFTLCGFDKGVKGRVLERMLKFKIHGKPLKYRESPENVKGCTAVVADAPSKVGLVLNSASTRTQLSIGVGKAFRNSGILLTVYKDDDGVVLLIDKRRFEETSLKLTPKLVDLAQDIY